MTTSFHTDPESPLSVRSQMVNYLLSHPRFGELGESRSMVERDYDPGILRSLIERLDG